MRGVEFIGLWMGKTHSGPSGLVLQILLVGQLAALGMYTADNILYGMARHGYNAKLHVFEALSNVVLSVALVRYMGVYGVALGTTIPLLFFKGVMLPRFVCKVTGTPFRKIVTEAMVPAVLCSLPFAIAVAVTGTYLPAASFLGFLFQAGVLFSAYAVWVWFVGMDVESRKAIAIFYSDLRASEDIAPPGTER